MSQALSLVKPVESADRAADELGRFAPSEPLDWHFGQGRYADEQGVPLLTRLRARFDNFRRWFWHTYLRQPKLSREGRLILPLFRGSYDTRAEARALCRTANDYVYAIPHGTSPLDAGFGHNPTLCFPLAEAERDAEQARLYAGCDLRYFACASLAAENFELRLQLAGIRAALEEGEHD
ncbi:MAG TPA: hypothetical protein VEB22_06675 [Phycisphaerales bacterium]|nr:hypothetical protein [Phycisphaerales bacterium]